MKGLLLISMFFLQWGYGIGEKNVCKYALDEKPRIRIDDHLQGIWKLAEDTDKYNYFIVEKLDDYSYCLTYMNRSGDNKGIEHGMAFFSEVGNTKFLAFPNWDWNHHGYVFLKIKDISNNSWSMTAYLVTDPSLSDIKSRSDLRSLFEKNMDNPSFYGKELHFHKKFEFNSCR